MRVMARIGAIAAGFLPAASAAAHAHLDGDHGVLAGSLLLLVAPYLIVAVVAALFFLAFRRGSAEG